MRTIRIIIFDNYTRDLSKRFLMRKMLFCKRMFLEKKNNKTWTTQKEKIDLLVGHFIKFFKDSISSPMQDVCGFQDSFIKAKS